MIDNFKLIRPLFYFNEGNNRFFHCQIVQRAKDHKPNKVGEGAIKTYFIRSAEHLDRIKDEIILLCEHYGARAYINIAGKDFEAMQKLMLMNLARNVTGNIVQNPRKILNSAAGELKSRSPKWIIDIDDKSLTDSVLQWLDDYFKVTEASVLGDRESIYLRAIIPTVQGVHLLVTPFNLQLFHSIFPDIDVHKNSMGTLLYYPKSLELLKYCCSVCGGTNIQLQAWVDLNNKYIEGTEDDECWCEDCQEHTKIKTIKK